MGQKVRSGLVYLHPRAFGVKYVESSQPYGPNPAPMWPGIELGLIINMVQTINTLYIKCQVRGDFKIAPNSCPNKKDQIYKLSSIFFFFYKQHDSNLQPYGGDLIMYLPQMANKSIKLGSLYPLRHLNVVFAYLNPFYKNKKKRN